MAELVSGLVAFSSAAVTLTKPSQDASKFFVSCLGLFTLGDLGDPRLERLIICGS